MVVRFLVHVAALFFLIFGWQALALISINSTQACGARNGGSITIPAWCERGVNDQQKIAVLLPLLKAAPNCDI
jgi:type IV secretory pathway TrbL component